MAELDRQIDHLARALYAEVCDTPSRHLTAIHVTCPDDVPRATLKALLTQRLAEHGLDFVDVMPTCEPGPIRLLSAFVESDKPAVRPPHPVGERR